MRLQLIDYNLTKIEPMQAITHNFFRSDLKSKQWLARITGICTKYGFERKFVNSSREKAHKFTLEKFVYPLEPGGIYQYKSFIVDDKDPFIIYDGFFATNGLFVYELEYEQVRGFLRMPAKSWGIKPEIKKEGEYAKENIPF